MKLPVMQFGESGEAYAQRVREDYVAVLNAIDAPFEAMAREKWEARTAVPPSTNRGEKSPGSSTAPDEAVAAIVDYLTFSAPWHYMLSTPGFSCGPIIRARAQEGDVDSQRCIAEELLDSIAPDSGLRIDPEPRGFKHFYERHFAIQTPSGEYCGFVAMLGARQRGTVCMELTGAGCAHVRAWAHTRDTLDRIQARITRVDCAYDDYEGRFTPWDAERWHAAGEFTTRGRPPTTQWQGWDDGSGRTFYVGKDRGNQQLCVYEKGREQGARDGDAQAGWVRWEGRFGAHARVIPLDVLLDPAAYLVGHFPPLRRVIGVVMARMRTSMERAAANLSSALRHAKRQCGAVLNLVKKHVPDPVNFAEFVVRHVVRDRLPTWLNKNPFGAESISVAFST